MRGSRGCVASSRDIQARRQRRKQEVAVARGRGRRARARPSVKEEDDREERAGLASWAGQAVLCWASTGKSALFIFLFYFFLTSVLI